MSKLFNLILGMVLLFSACQDSSYQEQPQVLAWLDQHWSRPLAPQSAILNEETHAGMDLKPSTCGQCHSSQYADWKASLHSKAASPGLLGQLMDQPSKEAVDACFQCHAPLAEQSSDFLSNFSPNIPRKYLSKKPDSGLHTSGLSCAGCHMRGGQVFGPPPLIGPPPLNQDTQISKSIHGGFTAHSAYEDPNFCAACHQFPPEGFALAGKLLENTYQEWKESTYAKQGITCQNCHMPERRHIWKGIHNTQMTKNALESKLLDYGVEENGDVEPDLWVEVQLANRGTGHMMPTYVTPKIILRFVQLDAKGQEIQSSGQVAVIARMVTLDLSQELYDTRLAPEEERIIRYEAKLHPQAKLLEITLEVFPDDFYRRFYEAKLKNPSLKKGRKLLEEALAEAQKSHYRLLNERVPILNR